MKQINWGILSTAKIGREKLIPPTQATKLCHVLAISSRNKEKAELEAGQPVHISGIPYKFNGSMPNFGNNYADDQMADIIKYLYQL